jgi:hypothetical protein
MREVSNYLALVDKPDNSAQTPALTKGKNALSTDVENVWMALSAVAAAMGRSHR